MKPNIPLIAALALCLGSSPNAKAQTTLVNLHNFSAESSGTNADGTNPYASLTAVGSALYGTAPYAGGLGGGTIFRINTDGSGFTNLHNFSPTIYSSTLKIDTNSGGENPQSALAWEGTNLFGVTPNGGSNGQGVVYSIGTDGQGFATLHAFTPAAFDSGVSSYTNSDGESPHGLIISEGTMYGSTQGGGAGSGVIFSLSSNGSNFIVLHKFTPSIFTPTVNNNTNADGSAPQGAPTLLNGVLYGEAYAGGAAGNGTVFRVDTTGLHFTNLHNFAVGKYTSTFAYTNADGALPEGGLTTDGSALYGTTYEGGLTGDGTIFKISLDGSGFTNLHTFAFGADGAHPESGLIVSNNILFGTAYGAGAAGEGSIFQLATDGSGFSALYGFTALTGEKDTNTEGALPTSALTMADGTLFGSATSGGANGTGTLFEMQFAAGQGGVMLNIQLAGASVILNWSAPDAILQSATSVNGPFADLPGATSPWTISASGAARFYRLRTP